MTQIKARAAAGGHVPAMDIPTLLARYDRRVPRYTSYPTAPHFTAAVDAPTYEAWLAALDPALPVSLYLHVPFCARLCLFCGCHTRVMRHPAPAAAYAARLRAEIARVGRAIGRRLRVAHIHWGGGTPHALAGDDLRAVTASLREHFTVLPEAETAIEVDPRTLDTERLAALADIGMTRASIGVQDFDPLVQKTIGREQSLALTAAVAADLRRAGARSLNLDLVYGLPHQTTAGVVGTIRAALALAPDRVAVFGYAHVPWMMRRQAVLPEQALPGPAERFAQCAAAGEELEAAGYQRIGLDHFALPEDRLAQAARAGTLRRNFQGYTADPAATLLGFGASAIGALPQGYLQNLPDTLAYGEAVDAGRLPVARGVTLTAEDRLRRAVIETLMCRLEVDLEAVAGRFGARPEVLETARPALDALEADGLARRSGWVVSATAAGRPFLRAIAAAFDTYLADHPARNAQAV